MEAARRSGLRGEEPQARRTIESGRRAAEREAWEQGAADPWPEDMPGLRRSRGYAAAARARVPGPVARPAGTYMRPART